MSRRILIVGAGFSGTAIALQLMQQARDQPLEIVLIERGRDVARGQAYASSKFPYLLNVPASRMSATAEDPDEFLRFARNRIPGAAAEDFLPRSLYGDYLGQLLGRMVASLPRHVSFRSTCANVIDIDEGALDKKLVATTADGAKLYADRVVIANGMPFPAVPRSIRCTIEPPALRATPWSPGRPLHGSDPIFVLGTGLTMVDVVCEAVARHPDARIHAISRHGLLAESQTHFKVRARGPDGGLGDAGTRTRRAFGAVRMLAREAVDRGEDWREVITDVRTQLPALWKALGIEERRRFLRHARCWWDIHRHRLPPIVGGKLDQLRRTGQLVLHAGRVQSIEPEGEGARVTWRPRGTSGHEALTVREVVVCTGPEYDLTHTTDRLWRSLLARGLAVADELGLGVQTSSRGSLVGRHGRASRKIHYLGPLLRAEHWESTAASELRGHAETLAARLLS